MSDEQRGLVMIRTWLIQRPQSSLTAVLAVILIMIAVLLLCGIYCLRLDTDLQAVSIALTGALSFVFMFEAIYKLSFYTFPWRMPPGELREFVIQVGTALTVLVGFAFGKLSLSRPSFALLGIFITCWLFWLLIGFPQLKGGMNFYPAAFNVAVSRDMLYALNRAAKIALCLVYLFFYKVT